jgi:hypothetical protein
MTIPFVIRWRRAFGVLAGATAVALNQQPSTSQAPDGPAGRIAIASKAPGVLNGRRPPGSACARIQGWVGEDLDLGHQPQQ